MTTFEDTIEEVGFLAKYLVGDEKKENDLIISMYRDLGKGGLLNSYNIKDIDIYFINQVKKEGILSSTNILDGITSSIKSNIKDNIIDLIIVDYISELRRNFRIDERRLAYLRSEIL